VKMLTGVMNAVKGAKVEQLGIEGASATVSFKESLAKSLPKLELVVTENLVERLRLIKDKSEVDATRVACMQARRAYDVVRASLTSNMTELEVAAQRGKQSGRFRCESS